MNSPYRIRPPLESDDEPGSEPASHGLSYVILGLGGLRVLVALLRHETCGTEVGLAAGLVAMALSDFGSRALGSRGSGNRAFGSRASGNRARY